MRDAIGAFAVATVVSWLATPVSALLARRVGVIHVPRERDLHERPTPGLGGLAILAAVLVAAAVFLPLRGEYLGILAGAVAITLLGAVDDRVDLHPAAKLAGQTAAATLPVAAGVYVDHVTLPFLGAFDLGPAGPPLTVIGVVAVVNAVNWTDGVDGLAAGVCLIAALTFAVLALSLDRDAAGVLAALTAGAAAGFLWHNFHPASVFMGDAGSNLLGLLLACVAIQGVLKTAAVVALFFPLMVLAVPAADATFVIAKRIKYRRPVYSADRWHFHHRFANIGFSQRRTVLYLYGWSLSLAALALALRFVPYSDEAGRLHLGWSAVLGVFALVALVASVYVVYVLEILKFRRWRERQLRRQVETGEIPPLSADQIEREIAREIETGEFEAVGGNGRG
ncbi:putative undecaprenyl-phosphate N-acetylglucosaminyl 1-phosphate transferase [bacterium HR41]|nr:putative undecaprenyl-phosphate N-acetylglucosaminyl 1-phosphate transferase [bacterium HR41]